MLQVTFIIFCTNTETHLPFRKETQHTFAFFLYSYISIYSSARWGRQPLSTDWTAGLTWFWPPTLFKLLLYPEKQSSIKIPNTMLSVTYMEEVGQFTKSMIPVCWRRISKSKTPHDFGSINTSSRLFSLLLFFFFFVLNHFTNHWDASMIDWFSCYYTYMTVRSVCVFVHERETEVFNVDILYRHDWN